MHPKPLPHVEQGRITSGPLVSTSEHGNNGAFRLRCPASGERLNLIVSDQGGWEHVSVSLAGVMNWPKAKQRTPTWAEMQWVKEQFWTDDEYVVQYHPAKSRYINHHPYVLHLWRPVGVALPVPPIQMV